jgi:hypothetical protein
MSTVFPPTRPFHQPASRVKIAYQPATILKNPIIFMDLKGIRVWCRISGGNGTFVAIKFVPVRI